MGTRSAPLTALARPAEEVRMDFFDVFASLFSAGKRPASRLERALNWVAAIGVVLMCAFIYLVFAGF